MPRINVLLLVALLCAVAWGGCDSGEGTGDSDADDDADEGGGDGDSDADADEEPNPNGWDQDPLCPENRWCMELNDMGYMACHDGHGNIPSGSVTGCQNNSDCPSNHMCVWADETETETACVENCGTCSGELACIDIADGYMGCLADVFVPNDAPRNCHVDGYCPGNATCWYTNTQGTASACVENCSPCTDETCGEDEYCHSSGECRHQNCTASSCGDDEICLQGYCFPDYGGGPGGGPGVSCDLPPAVCTGGEDYCGELIQFSPVEGEGYVDYPERGETWDNQYRSWARREVVMSVQYAAAKVACKAADWAYGNGGPIGLADMSEEDGAIPGTSIGEQGHATGTHTNGFDIDIAYYQEGTEDNRTRAVCDSIVENTETYRCLDVPDKFDPWRTALFVGALLENPNWRVIGVDGMVGPMLLEAIWTLCDDEWLDADVCTTSTISGGIAYEQIDLGRGWYRSHWDHLHASYYGYVP